jgi:hypothetical protein
LGLGDQQGSFNMGQGKRNYIKDFSHPEFPHGKLSGHKKGCRCLECKRAKADYNLKQKGVEKPAFRKLLGVEPDHPDYPHGTRSGYRYCKCKQCRKANSQYKAESNAAWRSKPENKVIAAKSGKAWRETEHGRSVRNAAHALRKALKRATQPTDPRFKGLLERIYRHCPEGYHVDHIKPLNKGGRHTPSNLQYLPAAVNLAKKDNEEYDCSSYAIKWEDLSEEPSTTIPQGSTGKRPEVPRLLIGA